jgi:hypothetical protein
MVRTVRHIDEVCPILRPRRHQEDGKPVAGSSKTRRQFRSWVFSKAAIPESDGSSASRHRQPMEQEGCKWRSLALPPAVTIRSYGDYGDHIYSEYCE